MVGATVAVVVGVIAGADVGVVDFGRGGDDVVVFGGVVGGTVMVVVMPGSVVGTMVKDDNDGVIARYPISPTSPTTAPLNAKEILLIARYQ